MAVPFGAELQAFGLIDVILWMLSFAIMYGVLSQVNGGKGIPQHRGSRAIISFVVALMVLFSAPRQLSEMISQISSSLLLVILGLLTLIVFIEAAGIKAHKKHEEISKLKGKTFYDPKEEESIFEAYRRYFAVALIFIALMIFMGVGGLNLIGLGDFGGFGNVSILGAGLFVMVILAIVWMIAESGEK